MVLKRKFADPGQVYLVGLVFFLLGVACEQIGSGGIMAEMMDILVPGTGLPASVEGFFTGLSIPFLMAAIYFQLRSLCMHRDEKSK